MRLHLKDLLSLANACSGFLAMAFFFLFGYLSAFVMVLLAMLADFLDGKVARKQGKHDDFGVQLDSLADGVSFALAPAALVFFQHYPATAFAFFALLLAGLFYLSAGLVRLAEYNSQKEKGFYYGLPSPFAAFFVLLFGWIGVEAGAAVLLLAGVLMLSKFKLKKVF
ncbi:MAG: CDP-alcohol phosphatidyltransferase family protein [Candidatus Norongarragalinales archaeon]